MVCHESYKDKKGNWLYPDEIEKISVDQAVRKKNKEKVTIGPPESMSKSKKNTIDPETMINLYGADAVRWFILSDSPPEKDVQWSDSGVSSSNKFLQKIWDLNVQIRSRKENTINKKLVERFDLSIDTLVKKIDKSIEEFKFNVTIAHFYEIYKIFNKHINLQLSNKCLEKNIIKTMKLMVPFTPHLALECLEKLQCRDIDSWPKIKNAVEEEIKFAVQVNGKTRDIISVKKSLKKEQVNKIIYESSKAKKFIENKEIIKTIFVEDKIMNYIVK